MDAKTLLKIEEDIKHLLTLLENYLSNDNFMWDTDDEEFKRQWLLFSQIRTNLNSIDAELFGDIRELNLENPIEKNSLIGPQYYKEHINPLKNEVDKIFRYFSILKKGTSTNQQKDPFQIIVLISKRFHHVARKLRSRYNNRPTLLIEDEYDVQDLYHSLLTIYFDDIRPEEWTPSYAGSSSRMDFLLKNEKTVIEIKKTRKGLEARQVGEQLIIDIGKYRIHPDCKSLICFVYDPEGRISNPVGFENDLTSVTDDLSTYVIVEPK